MIPPASCENIKNFLTEHTSTYTYQSLADDGNALPIKVLAARCRFVGNITADAEFKLLCENGEIDPTGIFPVCDKLSLYIGDAKSITFTYSRYDGENALLISYMPWCHRGEKNYFIFGKYAYPYSSDRTYELATVVADDHFPLIEAPMLYQPSICIMETEEPILLISAIYESIAEVKKILSEFPDWYYEMNPHDDFMLFVVRHRLANSPEHPYDVGKKIIESKTPNIVVDDAEISDASEISDTSKNLDMPKFLENSEIEKLAETLMSKFDEVKIRCETSHYYRFIAGETSEIKSGSIEISRTLAMQNMRHCIENAFTVWPENAFTALAGVAGKPLNADIDYTKLEEDAYVKIRAGMKPMQIQLNEAIDKMIIDSMLEGREKIKMAFAAALESFENEKRIEAEKNTNLLEEKVDIIEEKVDIIEEKVDIIEEKVD